MTRQRLDAKTTGLTRPARLIDVARLAKVSCSVAGLVLNQGGGNSRVSVATAERIRQAGRTLNYRPNPAARLLRGKRSHTLGLMVASAGDPLRSFLVEHLDVEAAKAGCQVLIANTVGNPKVYSNRFDTVVEDFTRRRVDGVFCAVHHYWEGDREALLAAHPRTVFYEERAIPDAPAVLVDRAEAVRLAVRHLAERSRRRIGLAVMGLTRPEHQARVNGYRDALNALGVECDERLIFNGEPFGLVCATKDHQTGKWEFPWPVIDGAIDQLVRDNGADAIVAHDDFWAAALLRRLRARGIRVPNDVALVGYSNHYLTDWTDPPLTTLDLSHEAAARQMVLMLERMIDGQAIPPEERRVKISPRLIVREST